MEKIIDLGFTKTGNILQEKFSHVNGEDILKLCDAIVQDYDSLAQRTSQSQASTAKNSPDHLVPHFTFSDTAAVGGEYKVWCLYLSSL